MDVTKYPNLIKVKNSTLVMGGFSLFHKGHAKLIDIAKSYKNPVVFMIIYNKDNSKNVQQTEVLLQQLANYGIKNVIAVEKTKELFETEHTVFIEKMKEITNFSKIIIGKDFAFGKNRLGNASYLKENFDVDVIEFEKINGKKISATLLYEQVEFGDIDLYNRLSVRPLEFMVDAKPDYSFEFETKPLHSGVYAGFATVNNIAYWMYLHINMKGEAQLYIEDLQLENTPFKATLTIKEKVRAIIMSKDDQITDEDRPTAIELLKK